MKQAKQGSGFTLLELLIVIAIIAILSVILVLVLNPAETLKKSRDAQRISDLNTVKTALGLYLTSITTPYLGGAATNSTCVGGGGTVTLFYDRGGITDTSEPSGFTAYVATSTTLIDGTGWIPVNLSAITGGSPISNFPLDPSNTVTDLASTTNADLVYRYACRLSPLTFELNAALESIAYTIDDNKLTKDGGNNPLLYEAGTDLTILPATNDF